MIAIVGAGISGLCLGHYLKKNGNNNFVIYEKEIAAGGKIKTSHWNDFNLEHGPNTLMSTPTLMELMNDLGLEKELIHPDESIVKQRYIKLNGKITLLPSTPQKLLLSTILNFKSKISIFKDLTFEPSEVKKTETVAEFFENHFSTEILEKLVTPFCRGIYASEPKELVLKTTFPKLAEIQSIYGSVIKGLKKTQSTEKRKVFTLKKGIQQFTDTLQDELEDHILNEEVTEIGKDTHSFYISSAKTKKKYEKVIIATPAYVSCHLIKSFSSTLSEKLAKIKYAKLNVQHRIYNTPQSKFPKKGFGVLYPSSESETILGHIWNSSITPSSKNKFLITTMFKSDDIDQTNKILNTAFSVDYTLKKEHLEYSNTVKWKNAIPVYDSAHLDFLTEYNRTEEINLYFCSNLINGVSIPDRVSEAKRLAEKLS